MKKIAVIGAMPEEITLIRDALSDRKETNKYGFVFYEGTLGNCNIVLAKAGVGKVNAAMCASMIIELYSPDIVINTGCMGGLNPELSVRDVVICTTAAEHDLDYDILGDARGTVFFPDGRVMRYMNADGDVAEILLEAAKNNGFNAKLGRIVSGDRFVSSPAARAELFGMFDADGCEMEGAAIAHVCTAAGIPFGIVRSVSDGSDGKSEMSFNEFKDIASEISARTLISFCSLYK